MGFRTAALKVLNIVPNMIVLFFACIMVGVSANMLFNKAEQVAISRYAIMDITSLVVWLEVAAAIMAYVAEDEINDKGEAHLETELNEYDGGSIQRTNNRFILHPSSFTCSSVDNYKEWINADNWGYHNNTPPSS